MTKTVFPMQGTRDRSLVRELDPTTEKKILHAVAKTEDPMYCN